MFMSPRLDTQEEVWFASQGCEPQVWSSGTLFKNDRKALKSSSPMSARHTLFLLKSDLFVDVKVRGSAAVLRRAFAFDSRTTTTGERAIHPFDEGTPSLPKETRPERIQPFGLWLHRRVTQLTRTAERNLRERL